MSRTTAVVAFSAWHLFAVGLSSIPPPAEMAKGRVTAEPPDLWLSRSVGPLLDRAEVAWNTALQPVWRLLSPVRRLTRAYTRAIALEQRWNMFQEPPEDDQYIHMRYYVRGPGRDQVARVDREMVFPSEREDRFHWANWAHYEEKAVRNARQAFGRALLGRQQVKGVEDLPHELVPVLRYYAQRHRRRLLDNETMIRAELWLGWARVPGPGQDQAAATSGRLAVLNDYLDDPRAVWTPVGSYPVLGTTEQESDITWTFAYYQTWP